MTTIYEFFKQFAPEYIEKFGASMPKTHLKVIEAIVNCRSGTYGMAFYECDKCHQTHMVNRSCGNRHAPYARAIKPGYGWNGNLISSFPGTIS